MCQVNITSLNGTPTGSGTNLFVQGNASECEYVIVRVFCNGAWVNSPILAVNSGTWSHQFTGLQCTCGDGIEVEAYCVSKDGNRIPNCQAGVFGGPMPCESECCLDFRPTIQIGDCDNLGNRLVTFNIAFSITNPSCLPYVLYLDFGDGNTSPPQVFNTVGNHVFTVTHLYNSQTTTTYNAILNYTLNTNCSTLTIPVTVQMCPKDEECCPIVSVQIDVGDCNPDCSRKVTIDTSFNPPVPPCPTAFLQWEYFDSTNTPILNGPGFQTSGISPHTEVHNFSAAQSPVKAVLKTIFPTGCPDQVYSINIPECDSPPKCPRINSFTADVKDCVTVGDSCCRKVEFTLDAFFDLGCGSQNPPQIELDFGDGSTPEIRTIVYGGNQQLIFDHEYCTPGNYTATLSILYPTGCPQQTLAINIPRCNLGAPVCPTISVDNVVIADDCNDNCEREVELFLAFKNPAPCNAPATFHIEWGDGDRHPNTGSITVSNSQTIIPFSHFYAPGSYTITVKVDTPSGCSDLTYTVDIPECPDCDNKPCVEAGCLSWLCPIFQILGLAGLGLGILWLILAQCLPALNVSIGLIFLAAGILFIVLYWLFCKCKPCGWFWLLLWKLFFGIGLMLLIFGACCNLWIYGLGLLLLAWVFFTIWRRQCKPDICTIYLQILAIWLNILLPAYGYLINVPAVQNCQIFIFGISLFWYLTFFFAFIFSLYLANCARRR